jgi:hypothetical protein
MEGESVWIVIATIDGKRSVSAHVCKDEAQQAYRDAQLAMVLVHDDVFLVDLAIDFLTDLASPAMISTCME